jgi:hypothetical protein
MVKLFRSAPNKVERWNNGASRSPIKRPNMVSLVTGLGIILLVLQIIEAAQKINANRK